jgi:hypothetical protein
VTGKGMAATAKAQRARSHGTLGPAAARAQRKGGAAASRRCRAGYDAVDVEADFRLFAVKYFLVDHPIFRTTVRNRAVRKQSR